MRSARVQPGAGVVHVDTAANLQAARIRRQRLARGHVVSRTEHDAVPALQPVAAVEFAVPRRGAFGDEVGSQSRRVVTESAADDLLYLAFMEVDARTKHGRECRATNFECRMKTPNVNNL